MRPETEAIINFVLFIMIIFVIFSWVYRDCIQQNQTRSEYNKFVNKNLKDKNSVYYADLCKDLMSNDVDCVMNSTSYLYHYTKDQERKTIRTPSQYAMLGGNCKDSAIFYATIFKNMNYTIEFRFPIPHHTSLTISKQESNNTYKYCDIEGDKAKCYWVMI